MTEGSTLEGVPSRGVRKSHAVRARVVTRVSSFICMWHNESSGVPQCVVHIGVCVPVARGIFKGHSKKGFAIQNVQKYLNIQR